ncbi:MAG: cytochrome P450 [Firmicutes bacterium]|nr:cytochrome P450 [Alicyclobacillaceae bacterium]MCL6498291.1 cytochrome P450 [Bacillota bacterium]
MAPEGIEQVLGDDFDPTKPETFWSAHEEYRELRQRCPVAHSNAWGGFWALFRYQDVVAVLRDPETYTTSVQNVVPRFAFTGRRPPLHLDPPEHTAYRRVINRFFRPERIGRLEPVVRREVLGLLEPLLAAGGGDISRDLAHKLPAYVFAEFFNVPRDLSMTIREITVEYVRAIQQTDDERVKQYSGELYGIARTIIEDRTAHPFDPEEDMTSALLTAQWNGEPLPADMVLGTVRQLIVTGMVAPSIFIGSMFAHLAMHPEIQEILRQNPDKIPVAVEEYLRLLSPYRGMARTARRDVVIGGRTIHQDEPIALVYASANRDETVFPDGDAFRLDRPNLSQHIAFGLGPHNCPGAPLARMMFQITLEETLSRTRAIRLDGPLAMTRWAEWGVISCPVRLETVSPGDR